MTEDLLKKLMDAPRVSSEENLEYAILYLIPTRKRHDSGYSVLGLYGGNWRDGELIIEEIASRFDLVRFKNLNSLESGQGLNLDMVYPGIITQIFLDDYKFKVRPILGTVIIEPIPR